MVSSPQPTNRQAQRTAKQSPPEAAGQQDTPSTTTTPETVEAPVTPGNPGPHDTVPGRDDSPVDIPGCPDTPVDATADSSPPADTTGHPGPPADAAGHPGPPVDAAGHPGSAQALLGPPAPTAAASGRAGQAPAAPIPVVPVVPAAPIAPTAPAATVVPVVSGRSGPAGQHTVRRLNSALVLDAIASAPGSSRASVATRTGLTKATVSSLVDRMIGAALVVEGAAEARSGPGRRGTALHLSPAGPHGLGVEVGVDYLATCLVDLTGRVRKRWVRDSDNRASSPALVLGEVAAAVRIATREDVPVGGIGVAVPGLVESASGVLRVAPNLGWREVDVRGELGRLLGADAGGLPVQVGNEANLAALAELWHGDAPQDFVHVSGEIGIGAGIVVDAGLFEGVSGFGGEIGHLSVDPSGPRCTCGSRGCLERLAGQDEILRAAGAADVADLLARLDADDREAVAAVRTAARWLGIALSGAVNLLGLPAVVLGGAYARLEPWLRPTLEAELGGRVVSAAWSPVAVTASSLGDEAAVRGAATSAVRAILADPEPYVASVLA